MVIENMAGASQTIGSAEVAKRGADGLSMLTCANVGMLLMPLTTQLTYDMSGFRHIAMLTSPLTMVVCVKSDSSIKTGEDWVKRVTNGESFTYSHPAGAGGLGQLAATDFLGQMGSVSGQFIAYNGSAEVMTALLNGEIDWAIIDEGDAASKVDSGDMKALYLISQEPSEHCKEILPGVPCLSEQNIANLELYAGYKWIAIRKDTPEEVVAWVKQQLNTAIQSPEYQGWLETAGYGAVREYSEEEITDMLSSASELYIKSFEQLGMTK